MGPYARAYCFFANIGKKFMNLVITDPALFDHKDVTFLSDTQRPPLPKKQILFRRLKKT